MLAKLTVRQKLTLLLLLPFLAVLVTSVPFAVGQIDTAVAAGSTVDVAERARQVGLLTGHLQEERVLALAYLATPDLNQDAFTLRTAATTDSAADAEAGLVLPRDVKLKTAIGSLRPLVSLRVSVLQRSTTPKAVLEAYHTAVVGLIDALGLTQQAAADATGIQQMNTLDALLRTNEEISRTGAGLVLASSDPASATPLVNESQLLSSTQATRFRQQAGSAENTIFNLVMQGPSGQRAATLVKKLNADGARLDLTASISTATTMVSLTRVQQERIARQIATKAAERAATARLVAGAILGLAGLLVAFVVLLSIAVSRSVSGPLRELTVAAGRVADVAMAELVRVADSEIEFAELPQLEAVAVGTADEIGEMAAAFNRVQDTAAKLMEQQLATRRNTAVMFANIARRTRSMVSRQLTFIDDLERNEQNERLLAKLYRLDHLTTRLHRSADSLLVVSGAREDERIVSPAPLPEVVRSAVAEIEGYQHVHAGALAPVIVAPQLVPDLRLVLAELLENATAFSPPGAPVEVSAVVDPMDNTCKIVIVDHGIGMSEDRLTEENRRLVERERLDVVPTSVLGLFVVGRLARRHGLTVSLERTGEQGITAVVVVPTSLFNDGTNQGQRHPAQGTADAGGGVHDTSAGAPSTSMLEALAASPLLAPGGRQTSPVPPVPPVQAPPAQVPPVQVPPVQAPVAGGPPVDPWRDAVTPEPVAQTPQPPARQSDAGKLAALAWDQPTSLRAEPPAAAGTPVPPGAQPQVDAKAQSPADAGLAWFVPPPDLPTGPAVPGSVPPDVAPDTARRGGSAPRHAGPEPAEPEAATPARREPAATGDPTALAGGPAAAAGGPSTMAGGPSTMAGGPSTMAGGPSTMAGGPSTMAGGPSTMAGGPTGLAGGPGAPSGGAGMPSGGAGTLPGGQPAMAGAQTAAAGAQATMAAAPPTAPTAATSPATAPADQPVPTGSPAATVAAPPAAATAATAPTAQPEVRAEATAATRAEAPAEAAAGAPGAERAGPAARGLTRRQPGGHLPSFGIGQDDFKTTPITRDAESERAELEAFAMGTAQAAAARLKRVGMELPEPQFQPPERPNRPAAEPAAGPAPAGRSEPRPGPVGGPGGPRPEGGGGPAPGGGAAESQPSTRGGLTRRLPGTHLSEYLRQTGPRNQTPVRASSRDADAERAALDSFIDGLARAEATPDQADHS